MLVTIIGLQWARQYERTDPILRRIIYGFNVYVQLLLLCFVLAIINFGVGIFLGGFLDTTEGNFYSLSEKTQEYIAQLDRPVQVYLIMPEGSETYLNMHTLLEQMRDLNPKYFNFEEVSPSLARGRIEELAREYPTLNAYGVIVRYGDQKENYSFIPAAELISQDFDFSTRQQTQRQFNGEVRLMQELYYLSGGKKKPVIYFTQDQGEPDLFDQNPNGMSALRQALTAANYVLKPLKFPNADVKVPDDADAVVVAGPQQPMTNSLPALKEYMENSARKGKLIVLLGPTRVDATTHAMRHLGLEDWLRKEWNVDITDEMIFTFQRPVEGIWT